MSIDPVSIINTRAGNNSSSANQPNQSIYPFIDIIRISD